MRLKSARQFERGALIVVVHGDQHTAVGRQPVVRPQLALGEGVAEILGMPHYFAGGAHLRPQQRIRAAELSSRAGQLP